MSLLLREERYRQGFGGENLKEIARLEDLGVCRMSILKCISNKLVGIVWIALNWLGEGMSGCCEHLLYPIREVLNYTR
jgi:hypothetical protein